MNAGALVPPTSKQCPGGERVAYTGRLKCVANASVNTTRFGVKLCEG